MSAVLAEPIVRLLFQRGQFTPDQTPVVASCLAAFSAGLVFNGAMLMLNRAFFSLRSNWIPTWIALGNLVPERGARLRVLPRSGSWGIPLATAICNIAGTWALLVVLRRRIRRIEGGAIASTTIRVVVASARRRRRRVGDLAAARLGARPLVPGAGRLARRGARRGGRRLSPLCRLLQVRELDALLSLRTRLRRA